MKKFIKFILVLGLLLLPCFSNASTVNSLINAHNLGNVGLTLNDRSLFTLNFGSNTIQTVCFKSNNGQGGYQVKCGDGNYHIYDKNSYYTCLSTVGNATCYAKIVDTSYIGLTPNQLTYFVLTDLLSETIPSQYTSEECQSEYGLITQSNCNSQYSGYILPSDCPSSDPMTSLECQSEYDLIPTSEITSNYCKLNFDLISPSECPSGGGCSGSGESIVFSNVYVNNVLYPGGADIYLNVNELLATEISYNSQLMYIDVDYDGDQDYINGIIDINTYQPTSNDFTQIFVGGLVRLFPYIVIALFIAFVRKLIRKIFK